jgi:hypothetical protein
MALRVERTPNIFTAREEMSRIIPAIWLCASCAPALPTGHAPGLDDASPPTAAGNPGRDASTEADKGDAKGECDGRGGARSFAPADGERFRATIESQVQTRDPETRLRIEYTAGGPRKLSLPEGDELVVIPFRTIYDRYSNRDCDLAVFRPRDATGGIVERPLLKCGTLCSDHCLSMRKIAEADVNDDGLPDFVFEVTVPSNRYPTNVDEAAVYLSECTPGSPPTYCYSKEASRAATVSTEDTVRAIRKEARRRGAQVVLACADTPDRR